MHAVSPWARELAFGGDLPRSGFSPVACVHPCRAGVHTTVRTRGRPLPVATGPCEPMRVNSLSSTAGTRGTASSLRLGRDGLRVPVPTAKLEPARPRHRVLPRPRLLETLSAGVAGRQLTLVVAPPGSGKTTLLVVVDRARAGTRADGVRDARRGRRHAAAILGGGARGTQFPRRLSGGGHPRRVGGDELRRRDARRTGAAIARPRAVRRAGAPGPRRLPRDHRPARAARRRPVAARRTGVVPARDRRAQRPRPARPAPAGRGPAGRGARRRPVVHRRRGPAPARLARPADARRRCRGARGSHRGVGGGTGARIAVACATRPIRGRRSSSSRPTAARCRSSWRRSCSTGCPRTCRTCSCARRPPTSCAQGSWMPCWTAAAVPNCRPSSNGGTASSSRSTPAASGSATTGCSESCCARGSPGCPLPSATRCTRGQRDGWRTTAVSSRRCATPSPAGSGTSRAASPRTAGWMRSWSGAAPRCDRCSASCRRSSRSASRRSRSRSPPSTSSSASSTAPTASWSRRAPRSASDSGMPGCPGCWRS